MSDVANPLVGYRPSGPPPDLRARIVREVGTASRSGLRDWLPVLAAAALIALFGTLSYRVHAEIDATLTVPDDVRPVEQWLPDAAGGLR